MVMAACLGIAGTAAAANDLPPSSQFAGYQVSLTSGSAAHASVQLVVPTVSCPGGQGGYLADPGVALLGPEATDTVAGYVRLLCETDGTVSSTAGAKVGDHIFTGSATISPGDVVRLYASEPSGPGEGSATIDDVSTGSVSHMSAPVSGQVSAAVEGTFIGINPLPGLGFAPFFTPVVFSQATVNQAPLGSQTPQGYNWAPDLRVVRVFTSPITSTGLSFKTTERAGGA
jgi:hypothetical protein